MHKMSLVSTATLRIFTLLPIKPLNKDKLQQRQSQDKAKPHIKKDGILRTVYCAHLELTQGLILRRKEVGQGNMLIS